MSKTKTIKATCLCGSSNHEITLPESSFPLQTTLCHCDSCRHMTGTLAFACTRLPDVYQPDQKLVDGLTSFEFSKKITQYNCSTCGAFVCSSNKLPKADHEKQRYRWDVMTGTLENIDGLVELQGHIYVGDTKDGGFADFLTSWNGSELSRWTRYNNEDARTPLDWRGPTSVVSEAPTKLHAHCKCGGVNFWIKRADSQSNPGRSRPSPSLEGEMRSPELAGWLRADSGKYSTCNCVCNSCRLATGMEVTQWAELRQEDITLDTEGTIPFARQFGTLKTYNSSTGVTRCFCSVCGAMTFFLTDQREGLVDVGVGLLAAAEGARAETWLDWRLDRVEFREDAADRAGRLVLALEEGLKQYAQRR